MGVDEEEDRGRKELFGVFTRAGGVWRSRLLNGAVLVVVLLGGGGNVRLLPMAPKTAMGFSERAILAALALALPFLPGSAGGAGC